MYFKLTAEATARHFDGRLFPRTFHFSANITDVCIWKKRKSKTTKLIIAWFTSTRDLKKGRHWSRNISSNFFFWVLDFLRAQELGLFFNLYILKKKNMLLFKNFLEISRKFNSIIVSTLKDDIYIINVFYTMLSG